MIGGEISNSRTSRVKVERVKWKERGRRAGEQIERCRKPPLPPLWTITISGHLLKLLLLLLVVVLVVLVLVVLVLAVVVVLLLAWIRTLGPVFSGNHYRQKCA